MSKRKKMLFLITMILGNILVITGVSYSALSYIKTGETQELIVGDIWMKYTESTKTINIEKMMPSEEYPNSYFEFEVTGKNTYEKKDIYYEILLDNGEYTGSDTNRTIPIDSQMLRFKLVEVVDGSEIEIFDNRAYSDISNKRIWVDTIGVDDSDYSKTYRLYARIYEHIKICSGQEEDCDYYVNPGESYKDYDWDKLYASIKVSVKGDLEEKSIETDASCFTYEIVKMPNPIMKNQDINDENTELYKCVDFLQNQLGWTEENEEFLESYCRGIVPLHGYSFQDYLDGGYFDNDELSYLQDNNLLANSSNIKLTSYDESCGSDIVIPREIDGYSINKIFGVVSPGYYYSESIFKSKDVKNIVLLDGVTKIGEYSFYMANIETIEIPDSVTIIGEFAFYKNNLRGIEIPNSVTEINDHTFAINQLTNIEIPNSVTKIGKYAFHGNNLRSIEIPDSVITIMSTAFSENELTSVTIGSGIQYIGSGAFEKEYYNFSSMNSNENLESITFTSKTCEEIKNIVDSESYPMKYFPWLATYSPYYQEGYKADIIGTDGVCNY